MRSPTFLLAFVQIALLLLLGFAVYLPTLRGEWMLDDSILLTDNVAIRSGSWGQLFMLWLDAKSIDYFPLTYSLFWVLWQCFGEQTLGYHIITLFFHLTGALLLWTVLRQMNIPGAWISALIFTIHPVCVETVAWISEMKNTLSLPLFLASCIYWIKQDRSHGYTEIFFYCLSLTLFLLSLLAKPTAVAMPLLTLLYAWWKRSSVTPKDIVYTIPFFLTSLVVGLVTIHFQHGRAIGDEVIPIGGFASRIALSGIATLFYLWKIIWPQNLLPIYPMWEVVPPKPWQFLAWPILSVAIWWMWQKRSTWGRHALFALGFFLMFIAPVLGFIDFSFMRLSWVSDHFLYLPMIGPIVFLTAVTTYCIDQGSAVQKMLLKTLGGVIILVLSMNTLLYSRVWINEDRLWNYTLEHNNDAWMAHLRLGARKFDQLDVKGACDHFYQAMRLQPKRNIIKFRLGEALLRQDRPHEAIRILEEVVSSSTHPDENHLILAQAYLKAQRYGQSLRLTSELLMRYPMNPDVQLTHSKTLSALGKNDQAIDLLKGLLTLRPNYEPAQKALHDVQQRAQQAD